MILTWTVSNLISYLTMNQHNRLSQPTYTVSVHPHPHRKRHSLSSYTYEHGFVVAVRCCSVPARALGPGCCCCNVSQLNTGSGGHPVYAVHAHWQTHGIPWGVRNAYWKFTSLCLQDVCTIHSHLKNFNCGKMWTTLWCMGSAYVSEEMKPV